MVQTPQEIIRDFYNEKCLRNSIPEKQNYFLPLARGSYKTELRQLYLKEHQFISY